MQNDSYQLSQGHTMKPKNQFSEKALESLETRIPQMAQAAFSQAHLKALTFSGKVLQVSKGSLVELSAEGSVRVIKPVEPSFRVQAGVKRVRKGTHS
jgi:hypothetical protein